MCCEPHSLWHKMLRPRQVSGRVKRPMRRRNGITTVHCASTESRLAPALTQALMQQDREQRASTGRATTSTWTGQNDICRDKISRHIHIHTRAHTCTRAHMHACEHMYTGITHTCVYMYRVLRIRTPSTSRLIGISVKQEQPTRTRTRTRSQPNPSCQYPPGCSVP